MNKDYVDILGMPEDHYIVSLLKTGDSLTEVPCKIYLPKTIYDKPRMLFKPNGNDFYRLINRFVCSLKSKNVDQGRELGLHVTSPSVYFKGGDERSWGAESLTEKTIYGAPQNLYVFYKNDVDDKNSKSVICFWLNENESISPFCIRNVDTDGSMNIERRDLQSFELANGDAITIDRQFKYESTMNGILQTSYLVGRVECDVDISEAKFVNDKLLKVVDDFLLIISFCSRHRSCCLGWEAFNAINRGLFFRGDYAFPSNERKGDVDDGLFHISFFQEAFKSVYDKFCSLEDAASFRSAVLALTSDVNSTVERDFLNLFSSLESLVTDYSRKNNREFIIDGVNWKCLLKDLRGLIRSHEATAGKDNSEVRGVLHEKMVSLNRSSLRDCFFGTCVELEVPFEDLWPLYNENESLPSLATIRNKLAHGDSKFQMDFEKLLLAHKNLRYLLERLMIRYLGIDLDKTNVSPACLLDNYSNLKQLMNLH